MRHRDFLGYLDVIVERNKTGRKDATFRLVPGLAGKCTSFESINFPNHFLRHQDFRLKLAEQTNEQLFKEDATFCVKEGLYNEQARSFESVNFPNYFIRHSHFELWLAKFDGSTLFKKDATFFLDLPLSESFPHKLD
jgi:hypothetical protein